MRRLSGTILLAGLCLAAAPALAQSSLGIGNAEVAVQPGSGALFTWIATQQQSFFAGLRAALVGIRNGSSGLWWLVGLSFVYGVFHAAGPGHGKAVISSYMLANEVQLRRGIALSVVSAFVQALTALLLVGAGWYLLRGTSVSMTQAGFALELVSYALVAGFGVWLLFAKARALLRRRAERAPAFSSAGLAFEGAGRFSGQNRAGPLMRPASGGFAASVCVDPSGDDCDCGRSHIADPAMLGGERLGLRSATSAVIAVGLRPCSGAIVVLTFSLVNGLYLAGVLSVFAMAAGTAITVSALAALAVFSKGAALRFGSGRARLVQDVIEVAGASLLMLLGLALLIGSLRL
ncbi:nickel/cobalt transporter [Aureimonas mangrovi]|uniref:nickel/cobalt transporter n=1 Tax=Aureimonas mangrovi TaxID=2758041 RepID=UPI00163DAA49|nr:nickel/cobalt transporter [Aureimonas mangrovi]